MSPFTRRLAVPCPDGHCAWNTTKCQTQCAECHHWRWWMRQELRHWWCHFKFKTRYAFVHSLLYDALRIEIHLFLISFRLVIRFSQSRQRTQYLICGEQYSCHIFIDYTLNLYNSVSCDIVLCVMRTSARFYFKLCINRHFFCYFHSTFVWDGPVSYLRFVYDEQHKTAMTMLLKATNTISNIFPGIR